MHSVGVQLLKWVYMSQPLYLCACVCMNGDLVYPLDRVSVDNVLSVLMFACESSVAYVYVLLCVSLQTPWGQMGRDVIVQMPVPRSCGLQSTCHRLRWVVQCHRLTDHS